MKPYWLEVNTRWGRMMVNKNDQWTGASLIAYGEYSPNEWKMLQHLLNEGDVAIDVGANIGALTLPMAEKVGKSGYVIAFEPQPDVSDLLQWNIVHRRSRCPIDIHYQAAGAEKGRIKIPTQRYDKPGNFGGVEFGEGETEVSMITIDSLKLNRLDLLKADVEGMEIDVVRGALETIKRCRPYLYLESDREGKAEPLIELLRALDYRTHWHCPSYFHMENYRHLQFPLQHFVTPNWRPIVSMNIVGVPGEKEMHDWETEGGRA